MTEEERLGGNLSDTRRVGAHVVRRAGPWTPTVHALLRHLDAAGFAAAPRPVAIDGRGREVLEFVEGETHLGWPEPLPHWVYERQTIASGMRLLRRFHDLSATFAPPAAATWRIVAPTPHEVICHNDWAPYNAIYEGRRVVAMLDWDLAGPGSRLWDFARTAYVWVPLSSFHAALATAEQGSRLRDACDAYGLSDRSGLIDAVCDQLVFYADYFTDAARRGDPGFAKLVEMGLPEGHREDAVRIRARRAELERQLL